MNRPIFAFSAPNVVAQKPLSREPLPSLQILTNDNRAFNVNPSFAHRASINSQPQSPGTTSRRKGSPVRSPTRESFPLSALEPIQVLSPSSALSSVRLDFFQLFMQSPVEMLSQNTLELEGLRILERKIREAEEYGKTLKLNPLLLKPLQRVRPSRKSLTSQERSASPVPVSAQDGENCTSQKDRNDRNNFGGRKRPSSPSKKTDGKKDRDQIKNGRYHPYREDYVPTTNSSSISTIENLKEAARGTSNSRKTPLTQTYNLDDLPVRKPKAIVIKANSKSPTAYEGTAIRLDDGQSLEPLPIERYNNTKGAPPIVWKGDPIDFEPDVAKLEDLTPEELRTCRVLRLLPIQYLEIKTILIRNWQQRGAYNKTAAQKMCRIDVNKTGKLYEWFSVLGWFS